MVESTLRPDVLSTSRHIQQRPPRANQIALVDTDPEVRGYFLGKLMRQAKPDDVFTFVTLGKPGEQLDAVDRCLGRTRLFWHWLLEHSFPPAGCFSALMSTASTGRTGCSSRPLKRQAIAADGVVGRHERELFELSLGDQQAVERIAMQKRKLGCPEGMRRLDG